MQAFFSSFEIWKSLYNIQIFYVLVACVKYSAIISTNGTNFYELEKKTIFHRVKSAASYCCHDKEQRQKKKLLHFPSRTIALKKNACQ